MLTACPPLPPAPFARSPKSTLCHTTEISPCAAASQKRAGLPGSNPGRFTRRRKTLLNALLAYPPTGLDASGRGPETGCNRWTAQTGNPEHCRIRPLSEIFATVARVRREPNPRLTRYGIVQPLSCTCAGAYESGEVILPLLSGAPSSLTEPLTRGPFAGDVPPELYRGGACRFFQLECLKSWHSEDSASSGMNMLALTWGETTIVGRTQESCSLTRTPGRRSNYSGPHLSAAEAEPAAPRPHAMGRRSYRRRAHVAPLIDGPIYARR